MTQCSKDPCTLVVYLTDENLAIKMYVRTVLNKFILIRLGFNISLYSSTF